MSNIIHGNRLTASTEELAAYYKARGMDRQRAWDQLIIDRRLNPGLDAKDFYKVFDSVAPIIFKDIEIRGETMLTHILKETFGAGKRRIQIIEETDTYVKWVDVTGATGGTPKKYIESLEKLD